ncbi:2-hydroxycarboxylate transporter family protein [Dickeya solani]|uniref:Na(+)-malate symporter n=1 Tax=Dickeya solani D s0432-1 TaxID=1231725 RepID=A0AAV3K9L5_9GAMM|nr:2-hydroxycarboxylate transporter family protein [Dickeya solani]ANE75310.1 malate permease [Dickeya solani IPO 2222]AUC42707.1 Malate Na(+) symporter [Dickeya solani RNS 08.23.3.1.A]AUH09276.1 malate permease [Dickeya solani D s0432-1]AUH13250.1 malate permease [Dickeya solani]AYQ49855.1 Citrate/malate transporter [Dickeya solani]
MSMVLDKNDTVLQRLLKERIGVFPILLYVVIAVIVFLAAEFNKIPNDMIGGFAVLMTMGLFLEYVGSRVPILKDIGGKVICTIFLPSAMVYYGFIHASAVNAITSTMKNANFLYFFVSCLITGSILGMDRELMINGVVKMIIPLILGSFFAVFVGLVVALLFGVEIKRAFFFIITPIMAGGLGEGAVPLSIAYSEILHGSQAEFLAELLPAALIGNLVAIILAGVLRRIADRKPHLTGNGVLIKVSEKDGGEGHISDINNHEAIDFNLMGGGLLTSCVLFVFGSLTSNIFGMPAPIILIFAVAIAKYFRLLPAYIETGAYQLYKFLSSTLVWALLVGVGVVYTPWKNVLSALTLEYIMICTSAVVAMTICGFYIGRFLNMHPIESALVTSCHAAFGGTGDIAILTASDRMSLIAFAQLSTKFGGVAMIIFSTMLLKFVS